MTTRTSRLADAPHVATHSTVLDIAFPIEHWTGSGLLFAVGQQAQNRGCRRIVIRRKASETCDETGMSLRYMLLALDPCL